MVRQTAQQTTEAASAVKPRRAGRAPRVCIHTMISIKRNVRATRVASALAAAGYDVTVIDVAHKGQDNTVRGLEAVRQRHIMLPGWTSAFYTPKHPLPWMLFKVMRWARGIATVVGTSADVYHASDLADLPACYVAARLRRKPLIYEAHELPLVQPHLVRRRWLHGMATRTLRRIVPRCAGVIAVSPPIAEDLHERFGGPMPVVLRNMPPFQTVARSNRLREHLGLPAETRIALYQGGLQEGRGLDLLVHAAKYLPTNTIIVIMGDGQRKDELEALIAREDVGDRVKMLPAVPYAELLAWTASADLGLIVYPPNHSLNILYCLPNKLFEFLMTGLPVLASPLVAIEEVLRTYDAGRVVVSLEPPAVAEAIVGMLSDPEALARMRQNALDAARRDLCWETEQNRLLALYAGLPKMPMLAPQPVRMGPATANPAN